jgi:hypothetical protein
MTTSNSDLKLLLAAEIDTRRYERFKHAFNL